MDGEHEQGHHGDGQAKRDLTRLKDVPEQLAVDEGAIGETDQAHDLAVERIAGAVTAAVSKGHGGLASHTEEADPEELDRQLARARLCSRYCCVAVLLVKK